MSEKWDDICFRTILVNAFFNLIPIGVTKEAHEEYLEYLRALVWHQTKDNTCYECQNAHSDYLINAGQGYYGPNGDDMYYIKKHGCPYVENKVNDQRD